MWGLQSNSQPPITSEPDPLPRPEELFAALNGGQKFTTLDLSEAYLQIKLEEGAAIFQCLIEQILPSLPGVVCYIDDILITGKDDDEHFSHLEAVLKSFKEYGFTIKTSKCRFFESSVEYLGKVINKDGINYKPTRRKLSHSESQGTY